MRRSHPDPDEPTATIPDKRWALKGCGALFPRAPPDGGRGLDIPAGTGWRMVSGAERTGCARERAMPGIRPQSAFSAPARRALRACRRSRRVRPPPAVLRQAIDRSLMDLPITATDTVMSLWQAQVESLAEALGLDELPLRVVVAQNSKEPAALTATRRVPPLRSNATRAEVPRHRRRPPRCVAISYAPDDLILVANGAQVLLEPLPELSAAPLQRRAAASPSSATAMALRCGLFLIRSAALTDIRDIGFSRLQRAGPPQGSAPPATRSAPVLHEKPARPSPSAPSTAISPQSGPLPASAAGQPLGFRPLRRRLAPHVLDHRGWRDHPSHRHCSRFGRPAWSHDPGTRGS